MITRFDTVGKELKSVEHGIKKDIKLSELRSLNIKLDDKDTKVDLKDVRLDLKRFLGHDVEAAARSKIKQNLAEVVDEST